MTIEAINEMSIDELSFETYIITTTWNGRTVCENPDEEALLIKALALAYLSALSKGPEAASRLEREIYCLFDDNLPVSNLFDPELEEILKQVELTQLGPRFEQIENRIKTLLYHLDPQDVQEILNCHKGLLKKAAKKLRNAGRKVKDFVKEHKTAIIIVAAVAVAVVGGVLIAGAVGAAEAGGAAAAAAGANEVNRRRKDDDDTDTATPTNENIADNIPSGTQELSHTHHDSSSEPALQETITDAEIQQSLDDYHRCIQPKMGIIPLPGAAAVAEGGVIAGEVVQIILDTAAILVGVDQILQPTESSAADASEVSKQKNTDVYAPDRPLPRDPRTSEPVAEADAPHTELGTQDGRKGKYPQAREFDANGNPVRDIDFTDHGTPEKHPNPHQHRREENPTGGTRSREDAEPLPNWEY